MISPAEPRVVSRGGASALKTLVAAACSDLPGVLASGCRGECRYDLASITRTAPVCPLPKPPPSLDCGVLMWRPGFLVRQRRRRRGNISASISAWEFIGRSIAVQRLCPWRRSGGNRDSIPISSPRYAQNAPCANAAAHPSSLGAALHNSSIK